MPREFQPSVYILASKRNGTLYTGVSSDLVARLHQHREKQVEGFTARYDVARLVWFEQHATMDAAITRVKRLKKWNRAWKLRLIEEGNPQWRDLAEDIGFEATDQLAAAFAPTRHPRAGGDPERHVAEAKLDSRLRGNDG